MSEPELAPGWDFFRDSESRIPIPGILGWVFSFWARSKNHENPEIPGIGIGKWKPQKNPEKSREQNPGYPKIPEIGIWILKSRKNFWPLRYTEDFLSRGSGFFSWDEISRQKANSECIINVEELVELNLKTGAWGLKPLVGTVAPTHSPKIMWPVRSKTLSVIFGLSVSATPPTSGFEASDPDLRIQLVENYTFSDKKNQSGRSFSELSISLTTFLQDM